MSEMVERVARAICKSQFLNGGNEDDDGWDSATSEIQRDYLESARAAIEAMREPTKEMVEARWVVRWPVPSGENAPSTNQAVWRAMIDAALR